MDHGLSGLIVDYCDPGLSWTIMDSHGLSLMIVDYYGLSWNVDYRCLSWIMDCPAPSWLIADYCGLLWITMNSGISWTRMEYRALPLVIMDYRVWKGENTMKNI